MNLQSNGSDLERPILGYGSTQGDEAQGTSQRPQEKRTRAVDEEWSLPAWGSFFGEVLFWLFVLGVFFMVIVGLLAHFTDYVDSSNEPREWFGFHDPRSTPKTSHAPHFEPKCEYPLCPNGVCDYRRYVSNYDEDAAFEGYTMMPVLDWKRTMLVDMQGRIAHVWNHPYPTVKNAKLNTDGLLFRVAQNDNTTMDLYGFNETLGNTIEEVDWEGEITNYCTLEVPHVFFGNDITNVKDGYLVLAWKHLMPSKCLSLGIRDDTCYGRKLTQSCMFDGVVNVKFGKHHVCEIVWEWWSDDHLVQDNDSAASAYGTVSASTDRIDVNYFFAQSDSYHIPGDSLHLTSLAYNKGRKEVMVSSFNKAEIYIIPYTDTSEKETGTAGNLKYRFGNPSAYGCNENAQTLFRVGQATYDGNEGKVLIFNNNYETGTDMSNCSMHWQCGGNHCPGWDQNITTKTAHSEVLEFQLPSSYTLPTSCASPEQTMPTVWNYTSPYFTPRYGGAHRLPNGNTLITIGAQKSADGGFVLQEVDDDGNVVWQFKGNDTLRTMLFRAQRLVAACMMAILSGTVFYQWTFK
ncbi:hypothetical protein CYMTET_20598 [Cymbomonas tetramitiformis]|uniref:Uncharacterized protein n=1 Tax=Cymbomonas tetramitiformis TaxID=36881 RepID=A0AAE0G4G2_9CHLO|nr:hypothetical protein CYMTET_20598 [Cymbomonas tetramitiformis]